MSARSPAVILCMDDDNLVRRLTAEVLRQAGFDVREAATGQEALHLARQRPDLVLLDVRLPDLSGFEVCRRLRADPATARIPLLHLSGVARSGVDRAHGLEGGADGYLVKPVEPAELVAQVKALLRLSRAEASLRESEERYRLLAENASAAVFLLDERSTILFANRGAERVFGYAPDELRGASVTRLMPPELRPRHGEAIARYLATGARSVAWEGRELPGLHRSGRRLVLDVSFGEFVDHERRRRFVGVVRDVTARKEAELALANLSRRLLAVQEAERRHIARELHDEVGQGLTALLISLHGLRPFATDPAAAALLGDARGLAERVVNQIRTLSLELRPPMMDDLGLAAALRWHVKGVAERTGLGVRLEADDLPERLPADLEMACFRVAQEALANAVKHAAARTVAVELRLRPGELLLTVRDDGAGFDVAAAGGRA